MSRGSGKRLLIAALLLISGASIGAFPADAAPAPLGQSDAGSAAASPGHSPIPEFAAANGVSCPRASYCLAVGAYNANGVVRVLTELWNGSGFSVIPSPAPRGAVSSVLNAIACSSASRCVAVGSYTDAKSMNWGLTELWNGWSWAVARNPGSAGAALNGVSCAGPSSCMAVGSYADSSGAERTLTEFWNGSAWSVVRSPNPKGATANQLSAVSCAAESACMATGSDVAGSAGRTLTEFWNGTAWSIAASPNPKGAQSAALTGVSCPTASRCLATGSYFDSNFVDRTLAESWDGSRWTLVPSPEPSGSPSSAFYGVSCASTARCLAVGHSYSASFAAKDETLAESWDGSRWSIVASPSPSTTSALYGVSCAAGCVAVGVFFNSADNYQTLAESWSGTTLSIVNQDAEIAGVACVDARHCVSVGSSIAHSVSATLAEFSDGTARWVVPTPNPANSEGSYLQGVSCLSATRCVAVGYYYDLANTRETLVESWNGVRWRIVPSPNPSGAAYSVLYGVSCVSASRCTAVGSSAGRVLAESWDGASWTIAATPDPATTAYAELNSVSCTASRCLAVGYETDTYYHADLTLAETWTNSGWAMVPSAAPGKDRSLSSVLHGTSCGGNGCLAVGYRQLQSGAFVTLTERWTGLRWVVVASPSPAGSPYSDLNAVSCVSTGQCTAVGTYFTMSRRFVPLTERWTGTAWGIAPGPSSPALPDGISYLRAVSCAASSTCLAGGASGNPANLRPLAVRDM